MQIESADARDQNLKTHSAWVQRWRDDIEYLRGEITALVMFRDDFSVFEKIVRGNARLLTADSPFPTRVKQWYVDSQIMRIRRLLEGKTKRNDVRSLRQLLEAMRRENTAFTRSSIGELFDEDNTSHYDAEMRDFLVSSIWSSVGETLNDDEQLRREVIQKDLTALTEASKRIVLYADKVVAHDTVAGVADDDRPKFSEIAQCITVIESVAVRYIATLTGASYDSLSPVAQYDDRDVFRFAWLPGSEELAAEK